MRVCNGLDALNPGTALDRWVRGCLGRDGVVTVEPWLDIVIEFSVECVSQHLRCVLILSVTLDPFIGNSYDHSLDLMLPII